MTRKSSFKVQAIGLSAVAPLLAACLAPTTADAADASDLARAAQNPIASMISLPIQYNANLGAGANDRTQHVVNVQPVVPFSLGPDWNLITRTIIPTISAPVPANDRTDGLGDIQLSLFLSPAKTSEWIWGAGVIAQAPSATDDLLGQGKWGLGPTAVVLHMPRGSPWVYGALVNNVWAVGGDSQRADVNQMLLQPFVNYNFPTIPGRYLSFSPIVTANWKASGDDRWTVPIGLGIGQIMRFGKQPVNLQAAAYYNVERPANAPDWNIRLQIQFLFPR